VASKLALGAALLAAALLALVYAAGQGVFGSHEGPGAPTAPARSGASVAATEAAVAAAATGIGVPRPKQVLFGDLHVHTTFSFDAFLLSLPMAGGEGAHPPADACDFARYCSTLDFWSINDHAFSITPRHWQETVESIRQCNEVSGDPADPDTVAFLGWEWTQVGLRPDAHYGHKNVVLADTDPERVPARPIAALRGDGGRPGALRRGMFALAGGGRLHDLAAYFSEQEAVAPCPDDVPVRDLPADCMEIAETPDVLYAKLRDWGHDAIVIPHGTTWGLYTPPGASWDKQLAGAMHDETLQTLFEIYSGHGEAEVYRSFRAAPLEADGSARCPAPSDDYLPTCWRAGEIIRERCLSAGESADECERRAEQARAHALAAGVAAHRTVPGARAEEWLDAGQCRDCREPAFNYRPGGSAQYVLAKGGFDGDPAKPRRFRPGLMASSDNHFARPGTGYKERHRRGMTESVRGGRAPSGGPLGFLGARDEEARPESAPFELDAPGLDLFETERQTSFFTTGGLVAAHAAGRDRGAIWAALKRREVYGTTGPRILLWFDLLNPPGSTGRTLPMGSEVRMAADPILQVRAVGSFEQRDGCPDDALAALSPERLAHLCKGECYHPGDRRRLITRIEIVRIRPQQEPGEEVASLIEDPWRSFACEPDPAGCAVTVSDPDFARDGRDTVYYARVFEAPAPAINAGNLRCERDAAGNCVRVHPCPGPAGNDDDCLAPHQPRAWSSPIWADFAAVR